MRREPTCPRCGGPVRAPGLWSSEWSCAVHGVVQPLQPLLQPSGAVLADAVRRSRAPLWLPWPLPRGWVVTGVGCAGDERRGGRAAVVACTGPAPLGGGGELLLVAEEPGIGLGARYAGLPGPDPGPEAAAVMGSPPHARLHADGHPTALWCLPGPDDRAVYVGEALGQWLWLVLHPADAGALLLEDLVLADLRALGGEIAVVPMGALTPRLSAGSTTRA